MFVGFVGIFVGQSVDFVAHRNEGDDFILWPLVSFFRGCLLGVVVHAVDRLFRGWDHLSVYLR